MMSPEITPSPEQNALNSIFLSPDRSRLRAGWRLLIQSTALLLGAVVIGIPIIILLIVLDPSFVSSLPKLKPESWLLAALGETIAITLSVFLARRFLDKQSIESLGLKLSMQALFDVLTGIGITLLQMGFIFWAMLALGWLTFKGFTWEVDPLSVVVKNTLLSFAIFVMVGWNEELLSRGYHLQTIASGLNLFWGVVISSAIFGVLHLGNPSATLVSTAGIFLAGIFFAYAYLRTKQLWLLIGLHLGWNFFEGVVFGFPVSGLDIYPLARMEVNGPVIWTGGAFGPEAGLIVLPALVLGALLTYLYTRNRAG